MPGAHDENCNVNITALEGLGDSFSDDSEWISATPKGLDNTSQIQLERGGRSRSSSPTAPPIQLLLFSLLHTPKMYFDI